MARATKHSYGEPGSFARLQEAAIAVADADDDDRAYEAACARLRNAARAYCAGRCPHRCGAVGSPATDPDPREDAQHNESEQESQTPGHDARAYQEDTCSQSP
jgi:hypothetical protein